MGALGGAVWDQNLRAALISIATWGGVQGHRASQFPRPRRMVALEIGVS